jgi:hypothetical protein
LSVPYVVDRKLKVEKPEPYMRVIEQKLTFTCS